MDCWHKFMSTWMFITMSHKHWLMSQCDINFDECHNVGQPWKLWSSMVKHGQSTMMKHVQTRSTMANHGQPRISIVNNGQPCLAMVMVLFNHGQPMSTIVDHCQSMSTMVYNVLLWSKNFSLSQPCWNFFNHGWPMLTMVNDGQPLSINHSHSTMVNQGHPWLINQTWPIYHGWSTMINISLFFIVNHDQP